MMVNGHDTDRLFWNERQRKLMDEVHESKQRQRVRLLRCLIALEKKKHDPLYTERQRFIRCLREIEKRRAVITREKMQTW